MLRYLVAGDPVEDINALSGAIALEQLTKFILP